MTKKTLNSIVDGIIASVALASEPNCDKFTPEQMDEYRTMVGSTIRKLKPAIVACTDNPSLVQGVLSASGVVAKTVDPAVAAASALAAASVGEDADNS